MDRRTFIKLTGLAGLSAAGAGCSSEHDSVRYLYSQAVPEEIVPLGQDSWFATVCGECTAGCSVLVRIVEGRAKKIEGNPLFPVNLGKTCARGQASLQGLYNPDRWTGPQRRLPDGTLEAIDWDTALGDAARSLQELRRRGQRLLIVTPPVSGHLHLVLHRFAMGLGNVDWVRWTPFESTVLRRAFHDYLGFRRMPVYRLEDADFVLSFGGDLLGTELSPVHYGNQYGRFRQGDPGARVEDRRPRGTWYHFEPRLSQTGSNADRWFPVEPGREGEVALALAVLLYERRRARIPSDRREEWERLLSSVSVEEAEKRVDVAPGFLSVLAERLADAERPLVIGAGAAAATRNASGSLWAILALQISLENSAEQSLVRPNPSSPLKALRAFQEAGDGREMGEVESGFRKLREIGEAIRSGKGPSYGAVFIWGVDLLHSLPAGSGFRASLENVPVRIVAASFPDDTSEAATLILPTHTPLESWGDSVPDPGPGVSAWGLAQPAVMPLHDTRAPGDLLLALAREIGGDVTEQLPWKDTAQAIDDSMFQLYDRFASRIDAVSYEEFFNDVVARGGWYASPGATTFVPLSDQVEGVSKKFPVGPPDDLEPRFEGNPQEFPFYLLPYPSLSLLAGEGANRPWLQELGDPLTTVTWGVWAEINPTTATTLGLEEGDLVRLETPFGSAEVPVHVYPGIRPDTIAVPAGGGHQAYGRFAKGRGANVMDLLPASEEPRTGAFAWVSTRVKVIPTGRRKQLAKLEGSGRWLKGSEFPV